MCHPKQDWRPEVPRRHTRSLHQIRKGASRYEHCKWGAVWQQLRLRYQGENYGNGSRVACFFTRGKDERSHNGSPPSLAMHDMGLSTVIGAANKDASGKSLPMCMKSTIERPRSCGERSQVHASEDRNMRRPLASLISFQTD